MSRRLPDGLPGDARRARLVRNPPSGRIVAEIQGMKDLGAAGVLIKPFDPRKLAADVLALLR